MYAWIKGPPKIPGTWWVESENYTKEILSWWGWRMKSRNLWKPLALLSTYQRVLSCCFFHLTFAMSNGRCSRLQCKHAMIKSPNRQSQITIFFTWLCGGVLEKKNTKRQQNATLKFEVDRETGGWKQRGRGWGKLPKCRKKTLGTSFTCTSLEKFTFFSPKNEGLVQDDFSFSKFVDFWGSSRSFSVTKLRRLRNHLCRSKEK